MEGKCYNIIFRSLQMDLNERIERTNDEEITQELWKHHKNARKRKYQEIAKKLKI